MSNNNYISAIKSTIEPLRQEIINHKVYNVIQDINDLKLFMQHHIFAVWDFMSLLKALQKELTCVSVPWFPVGNPEVRYLINEIVVGEESDIDETGNRKSHFELYLEAMEQCGANTEQIILFLENLKENKNLEKAFDAIQAADGIRQFVGFTFDTINSKKAYLQAAVFTFGREDLIPGMFISIVNDIYQRIPSSVSTFKYYLERHIEVDGDHHSNLALQMTSDLCENDENRWKEAETAIVEALKQRISLWDAAYEAITANKALLNS